jgi:hypothetical protein
MMIRKDGLSERNTAFITQDAAGQRQLHAARIPGFYRLLAKDRKAAIATAVTLLQQHSKAYFCAIVMTRYTIHAAMRGESNVYLGVKNKKQELIYFGKINTSLYSLEEDDQHDEEKSALAEEKSNASHQVRSRLASEKYLVDLSDIHKFNAEVSELIFSLYLKVYTSSRKSGSLFSLHRSALADRDLARSLAEILLNRFPEIATVQALKHIQEQPAFDPEHKKSHTNTGKLLSLLGSAGMAESARLFKSNENSRVKKSVIKQFYADNIESRNRLK